MDDWLEDSIVLPGEPEAHLPGVVGGRNSRRKRGQR